MEDLLDLWIAEQKKIGRRGRKPFIGVRGYKHFDSCIGLSAYAHKGTTRDELICLRMLKEHKYWPFIRDDKAIVRYAKNSGAIYKKKKNRPIMYAAHRDAAIFSFYSFILKRIYEERIRGSRLENEVIAYRRIPAVQRKGNKSNIDFAKEIYELVGHCHGENVVFCFDVSAFFDNMSHEILLRNVKNFLDEQPDLVLHYELILKPILKYRYVFRREAERIFGKEGFIDPRKYNQHIRDSYLVHKNKRQKGIPQGSPISDILSNIYMYEFDMEISNYVGSINGAVYRRYCDDIFIMVPMARANEVFKKVSDTIKLLELELNNKKTEAFLVDASRGVLEDISDRYIAGYTANEKRARKRWIQYLGFEFDLQNIYVRAKSVSKLYHKVRLIGRGKHKRKTKRAMKGRHRKQGSIYCYIQMSAKRIGSPSLKLQEKKIRRRTKRMLSVTTGRGSRVG